MAVDKNQVELAIRQAFELDKWAHAFAIENNGEEAFSVRSNRGKMWDIFSDEVVNHIEHYTVAQYKDFPEDQVTEWTEEDLVKQIQKYINRISSNERGDMERNRDLMKIAHYAQMIWSKRLGFEDAFKEVIEEMKNEEEVDSNTEETKEEK